MSERAYVVAIIKRGAPSVVIGAAVFGEEHPTLPHITIPLADFEAETFGDACVKAEAYLTGSHLDWCGAVKNSPTRGAYREAGQL